MTVSNEDKDAMSRLLQIMNGEKTPQSPRSAHSPASSAPLELAGAGQVTRADVDAMAQVLTRLNNVVGQVSTDILLESDNNPELAQALVTETTYAGIKIGRYEIKINLDETRLVNKQHYSVVNKISGEVLAHELGLYEAAHGLVKMLNSGLYINSQSVRDLLEAEAAYTSHKMDAIRFKRRAKKSLMEGKGHDTSLFEARRVAAMDKAMTAKSRIKKIYNSLP
jgi:hypothetical protein